MTALLVVFFVLSGSRSAAGDENDGYASCYGDYQDRLSDNSVACGYGSFISGEDFTYTTAICSDWVHSVCGSCYAVRCDSGKTANMGCSAATTHVRVIDSLGKGCSSGQNNHVFDLSTVPYSELTTEGGHTAGCSGEIYVKYAPVSCSAVGIVSGGMKIGIQPNQQDPWCPPFWFTNVGGAGALSGVQVSSDGGITWFEYQRNAGNGGRWDCKQGNGGGWANAGNYLGKSLSFKLELCDLASLPETCTPSGDRLTLLDALPASWCANGASPCASTSWQMSNNFDDAADPPTAPLPTLEPTSVSTPSTPAPSASGATPAPSPPSATPPPPSGDCASVWGQCGGVNHVGPTCCAFGSMCSWSSKWYSQCIPNRRLQFVSAPQTSAERRSTELHV